MISLQELLLKAGQTLTLVTLEPPESLDNVVALVQKAEALPSEKKVPLPPFLRFITSRISLGQRDAALQVGIIFDYAWRIVSFLILTFMVGRWPIVGVVINLLGAYLIFESVHFLKEHFSAQKDEHSSSRVPQTSQSFWWVVIKMELLNIVFSADSFATAWAITHDRVVLIVATLIGIGFTRFGIRIAKPVIQDRWHPAISIGVYTLIGIVGLLLLAEIPMQLVWQTDIPEAIKIALVFLILAPFVLWAEIAYYKRNRSNFLSNPAKRYSIQPIGPVLGGHVDGNGRLFLLLAKEYLHGKKINTLLFVDTSLSCAKQFQHGLFRKESAYEQLVRYFGSALASIDTDGRVDVYLISMGVDGKGIECLGTLSTQQFARGVRISSRQDFGEKTDVLTGIQKTEEILTYETVQRFHSVLLSDGKFEPEQLALLQQEGLARVNGMLTGSIIDSKLYFIVGKDAVADLDGLDNLPDTRPEDPDPYEVYGYKSMAEARQLTGHILDEALRPVAVESIRVGSHLRLWTGKGKHKRLLFDNQGEGVFGTFTTQIPRGTTRLVLEIDGHFTPITISYV